ncbi:hypothetical protein VF21_06051 [Pseudogymnoascus sp. 05NY08]|nr:hypothetical protein VF21_06051 [Pseudogymnoascus sp. 05NY08]
MYIPPTATLLLLLPLLLILSTTYAAVAGGKSDRTVSPALFADLEEAARLADIAYCVGISGIWRPFGCLSRCGDFEGFELVDTWNTGPLRSDSCGYIALDHVKKRIVVAFRGTYSLASVLADLATTPQVYVPYPEHPPPTTTPPSSKPSRRKGWWGWLPRFSGGGEQDILAGEKTFDSRDESISRDGAGGGNGNKDPQPVCTNCTVHAGFLASWTHTRPLLLPHLTRLPPLLPDYEIHLIGHSLGGALAALAGLELRAGGVEVVVTTFGEPRIGNKGLVGYLDRVFELDEGGKGGGEGKKGVVKGDGEREQGFRRVTHRGDPVPLLPLEEWGYAMHGGEIYISSPALPVQIGDVEMCVGDEDERCIAGSDGGVLDAATAAATVAAVGVERREEGRGDGKEGEQLKKADTMVDSAGWRVKSRFRIWQLLFAHRDYFWRVGLCVPGGDPGGWGVGRGWYGGEKSAVGGETVGVDEL